MKKGTIKLQKRLMDQNAVEILKRTGFATEQQLNQLQNLLNNEDLIKLADAADFCGKLKKAGHAMEQQLNQGLQNLLNNENLTKLANAAEFYGNVKKTGLALEQQVNQGLQNLLSNEDLVKFANAAEFYGKLKKTGLALEQQINQRIQNLLNDEDLVKLANEHLDLLSRNFRALQNTIEVLFNILQVPTKNDVANVAKLTLQTEEKVDNLEEHIIKLTETVEKALCKDMKAKKGSKGNV